jgi:alanine dehydrogenase
VKNGAMTVGVLAEQPACEQRVCLTPAGAGSLVQSGLSVLVETGAGLAAHFSDEEYRSSGARIVYDRDEVFGRCDLLAKISALRASDILRLRPEATVLAFHHLAASNRDHVESLMRRGATLVGYEILEDDGGDLPVLHAMSEIAGQLAVHVAARYLESPAGGRGVLLGGATGIPPAHVVILGAGVVGFWAARAASGQRAQVTLMDSSLASLRRAEEALGRNIVTESAHPASIDRAVRFADALIGAVLVRGERAPLLVTRDMVQGMKAGAVIVDVSIDQGGCVETSRPTTLQDPVFREAGITHYAVPNMASAVARTASMALSQSALGFIQALACQGLDAALQEVKGLAAGLYVHRGRLVSASVAHALKIDCEAAPTAERARPRSPIRKISSSRSRA